MEARRQCKLAVIALHKIQTQLPCRSLSCTHAIDLPKQAHFHCLLALPVHNCRLQAEHAGAGTGNFLITDSLTDAQTTCSSPATGQPANKDCLEAAMDLGSKEASSCVVPNATAPSPLAQYQTTQSSSLAQAGSCQIILGGGVGNSLPCSQISQYARNLTAVCGDSDLNTGAVFYPDGFQFANSAYIALTTR